MNRRHFDSRDNAELRAKIDKARPLLPMPALMRRLGYNEKHIGKNALCPFHDDHRPSFSVFKGKDGFWHYKCFVCDAQGGDEITFLVKHFNISRREAITRYLDMAGFPKTRPLKSRGYPVRPASHVSPASPVSEGQSIDAEVKRTIEMLAAKNACNAAGDAVRTNCFQFARDLKAVEKKALGRTLTSSELRMAFDEWHRLSQPFLDAAKSREDYWTAFLAQFPKIRFATGEGILPTALENVSKLSIDKLPMITGYANAPETYRRILALHLEMWRLVGGDGKTYFLDYRSAAKACPAMTPQKAHDITHALETLGAIEIVSKGKAGLNSGQAAEFRYLSHVRAHADAYARTRARAR